MVLTTKAGSSTYAVAMYTVAPSTTAYNGDTPPTSGDGVFFFCKDLKIKDQNEDKYTVTSAHTVLNYLTNKLATYVTLVDCTVVAATTATATQELDAIRDFIYTYGSKAGASAIYLQVKHTADNRYVMLSWNSSHAQYAYLKGRPVPTEWTSEKGKYYTCASLVFREVP